MHVDGHPLHGYILSTATSTGVYTPKSHQLTYIQLKLFLMIIMMATFEMRTTIHYFTNERNLYMLTVYLRPGSA